MKKTSRKHSASPGVAAGAPGSAALAVALRADADSWEACGKALGYMDEDGERRGKERIALLRAAADRIDHMTQTLHMVYEHALDMQSSPACEKRLTPAGQRELGRRLARYWCEPNTKVRQPR